ncbi:hypothetical protein LEMLEM_LOCUS12206, partial [Lemmus lemmus]
MGEEPETPRCRSCRYWQILKPSLCWLSEEGRIPEAPAIHHGVTTGWQDTRRTSHAPTRQA